jgi:hypothetical protein
LGEDVKSDWLWSLVAMVAALATVLPAPLNWLLQLLLVGMLVSELAIGKALNFLQGYGPWIATRDAMPNRYWASIVFLGVLIAISLWNSESGAMWR